MHKEARRHTRKRGHLAQLALVHGPSVAKPAITSFHDLVTCTRWPRLN